ncbi:signal recognition particle 14kD protein-domain-containing protein [Echria macrotheca]|uniref:Signal recognition particle subunit SRP14 n=1 Tax=Echria macrotheca TaxID=438768 RepID=A0AAJ0B892_9PEZI|nr:signal recognition particle 14kD protein-domain-containing protein [Echria macrotheca]
MGELSQDEFFTKLSALFQTRKSKATGAIYLTQKRFPTPPTDPSSPTPSSSEGEGTKLPQSPILIRATNAKSGDKRADRVKLSTRVNPDQLDGFYARYAEVCKAGMGGLKPRDRTRRKAKGKKRKGAGAAGAP